PEEGTVVVTKIGTALDSTPARKRFDVEYLRQALGASQDRLGRKRIDVLLLHNPSLAVLQAGVAGEFLESQVAAGKLAAWGVSAGNTKVAAAALAAEPKPAVLE